MDSRLLVTYARSAGLRYGWRRRPVAWALDLTDPAQPILAPHTGAMTVPYARRSGTKPAPRPGCDTLTYLVERHRRVWQAATAEAVADSAGPAASAFRAARDRGTLNTLAVPAKAKRDDLVAVHAAGQWLHEDPAVTAWWHAHQEAALSAGRTGLCLSCGHIGTLSRLVPASLPAALLGQGAGDMVLYPRPKGTAARGGQSERDAPVMCLGCACAIGAAVTELTTNRAHHRQFAADGTLAVWWDPSGAAPLPLRRLLDEPDPALLSEVPQDGRLCVLLMAASGAGRLTMRRWWDLPARAVAERIEAWYGRIGVWHGWTGETRLYGVPGLHAAIGRWDRDAGRYVPRGGRTAVPEHELWCAALDGTPPRRHAEAAWAAVMRDNDVSGARVALIQEWAAKDQSTA